jgi:metal-responsive CopG/Arc/MetJ family transcriptional regulator
MKWITVSLPDELAEQVKRAAGGERRVSSYVAAALEDYAERETWKRCWPRGTPRLPCRTRFGGRLGKS